MLVSDEVWYGVSPEMASQILLQTASRKSLCSGSAQALRASVVVGVVSTSVNMKAHESAASIVGTLHCTELI
jgi:hypothetical protein